MAKTTRRPPPPPFTDTDIDIETTVEGTRYTGSYRIEHDVITVRLAGGETKKAHLSGMSNDTLARMLLGELIADEQRLLA